MVLAIMRIIYVRRRLTRRTFRTTLVLVLVVRRLVRRLTPADLDGEARLRTAREL
jgi:hypothetical protein